MGLGPPEIIFIDFCDLDLIKIYGDVWEASDLTDLGLYQEGRTMLTTYARRMGHLSHFDVLGTEVPFEIHPGPYTLRGSIDRADRVDETSIRIIDYKSNRLLYGPGELKRSLQLAIYTMAARSLWPWADTVTARYEMLRHDIAQETEFSDVDLEDVEDYLVRTIGRMETRNVFPARTNAYCGYCQIRTTCDAYRWAIDTEQEIGDVDVSDLTAVAAGYSVASYRAKMLYGRKRDLEAKLIAAVDQAGPLELDGTRFSVGGATATYYNIGDAAKVIAEVVGVPEARIAAQLGTAHPHTVDAVIRSMKLLPYQEQQIADALQKIIMLAKESRLHSEVIGW